MLAVLIVGIVAVLLAVAWIPFARRTEPEPGIGPWLDWPFYGTGALVVLVMLAAFGVFCIGYFVFVRG